ncbi:MAG: histidine kinase, partial [Pseudomonas sp.]
PTQAPADNPLPKTLAQAVLIAEALQAHGGPTEEAKESLHGPLVEELDLDKVFDALPAVLEADKAFPVLLG